MLVIQRYSNHIKPHLPSSELTEEGKWISNKEEKERAQSFSPSTPMNVAVEEFSLILLSAEGMLSAHSIHTPGPGMGSEYPRQ